MTEPTAPNAATAQARVLADELARCGVRHVLVCPGSRSAALAIAVHQDPRLAVHIHPDERSAAFVALGIGRATGLPAAVIVTSGTAVANLLPATVEADRAGVPLLLLTADRPPELRDTGANQTIAQRDLLGRGLRWTHEFGVAEDRIDAVATWRAGIARAVAVATGALGAVPGPVHLNLPTREPTVPVSDDGRTPGREFTTPLEGRGPSDPWVEVRSVPRSAPADLVGELARRFVGVERGLVLVGAEVGRGTPATVLDALSRATGWPVLAEGHTPARHGERTLRAGSWLVADSGFAAAHRPEIVVRVGRPTLHDTWGRLGSKEMVLDPHGRWEDPWRRTAELMVVEPGDLLAAVTELLAVDAASDWWSAWTAADRAAAAAVETVVDTAPGLTGAAVAREVLAAVPAGAELVVGASLPIRDVDLVPTARPDVRIHANRGAAGIDGTVATALGAGLGTGLPVWALLGDQTLLHDGNAFLLRAEADPLAATFVVVDNDGGHVFDGLPPGRHAPALERLFSAPHGLDLRDLAGLHRVPVAEAGRRGDLAALLADRAIATGPGMVVARVDAAVDLHVRRAATAAVAVAIAQL